MEHITQQTGTKFDAVQPRKFGRPNALRKAQVLPPHQVDLTLSSAPRDDLRVQATISGAVMSKRIDRQG